ncbi:heterokaryon incompatibility protein [Colletotrichum caudatum]|nr:heterokaryon incompatibility protein [Colletotrichum caudatum]
MNGSYRLRWPAGVDYKHEDKSSGKPSSCRPGLSTRTTFHDQASLNNHRGSSSACVNLENQQLSTAQTQSTRTNAGGNFYKPPRCYPVFWSNDEIRILELDSSSSGSLLHGSFTNVRLGSEQAQYEAVSYTWADASGDSTRCRPMFIGPFWDIVPITRNCENALQSVRISYSGPPRKIWIDSLCINQDDEKERSAQVALMPRVYADATSVLVYLGPASEDSDMALHAISRSRDGYICEVTLARSLSIFCGSRSTVWPLEHIKRGLPVSNWTQMHEKRGDDPGWELLGLMTETSQCFCSDPRDRIFALLGMLQRLDERTIAADYSLTSQEVSIGIAAWLVQKCGRGREVLLFAGINRGKRRRLPTWVPDFVEPLKPDWRIRGLLERFLEISGDSNTAVEARKRLELAEGTYRALRLSFQPLNDVSIQINPRTSGLHLTAIKLSNLKKYFKPVGEGERYQPFARYGFAWRAVVLVPKAPCGSRESSSWLNIISAEDDLYWLYGIEGFAILRPNYDRVTHSLVCACDVVLQALPSPRIRLHEATQERPLESKVVRQMYRKVEQWRWAGLLTRLSDSEEHVCSEHLKRILEQLPSNVGPSSARKKNILENETQAREALLDIAFELKSSPHRAEVVLWESWQRMEQLLRPFLECDKGLWALRDAFEAVDILPLSILEDGRARQQYVLGDCYIQSFEAIAELLWSLLPSEKTPSFYEGVEPPELSAVEVLRELRDWADLTTNLLSAIDRRPSTGGTSLSLILPCSGMQQEWRSQWTAFRRLMPRSEPFFAAQDMLSMFSPLSNGRRRNTDVYFRPGPTRVLWDGFHKHMWDWDFTKVSIARQRSFWETVGCDKWLRSWPLLEQLDISMVDGDQERVDLNRTELRMSVSEGRTDMLSDSLEVKMAVRLYLREFGFDLDLRTDVIIR